MSRVAETLAGRVVTWADGVSKRRTPSNTVIKLVAESSELLDAVINTDSREAVEGELGDCIILLLDIAHMYDIDLMEAGHKKMDVNDTREWYSDNGVIRRRK